MPQRLLVRLAIGELLVGLDSVPIKLDAKTGCCWWFHPSTGQPGKGLSKEAFHLRRVIDQKLLDHEVRRGKVELEAGHRQQPRIRVVRRHSDKRRLRRGCYLARLPDAAAMGDIGL